MRNCRVGTEWVAVQKTRFVVVVVIGLLFKCYFKISTILTCFHHVTRNTDLKREKILKRDILINRNYNSWSALN